MSATLAFILTLSLAALSGEFLYRLGTRSRDVRFGPRVFVLVAAAVVLLSLRPGRVEHMGSLDETASMIICYAAMLLGMTAEYGYSIAERRARGETAAFDTLTFLLPVFASPIVFIPLLTLTSELGTGGAFSRARLMVYLVAFQNGFFWKQLFEQRRQIVTTTVQHQPAQLA